MKIDVRDYENVIEILNAILNNGGIAEIKNEGNANKINIAVVEIKRTLKTTKERK